MDYLHYVCSVECRSPISTSKFRKICLLCDKIHTERIKEAQTIVKMICEISTTEAQRIHNCISLYIEVVNTIHQDLVCDVLTYIGALLKAPCIIEKENHTSFVTKVINYDYTQVTTNQMKKRCIDLGMKNCVHEDKELYILAYKLFYFNFIENMYSSSTGFDGWLSQVLYDIPNILDTPVMLMLGCREAM